MPIGPLDQTIAKTALNTALLNNTDPKHRLLKKVYRVVKAVLFGAPIAGFVLADVCK